MKFSEVKTDELNKFEKIIDLEQNVFGDDGAVDKWALKPFVRYGKVYTLEEHEDVLAVVELLRDWSGKIAYIYGISVKKGEQGKGLGTRLLKETIAVLGIEKLEKIALVVDQKNEAALALYTKFGFKKRRVLKDEYAIGIDRILMEYVF